MHTVAEWLFGKCYLQTYFSNLHYVLKLRFREQGGEGTVTIPQTHASYRFPHCPQDPPEPGKPTTASKEHCSTQTLEQRTLKVSSPVPPPSEVFPYPAPPHQPLTLIAVHCCSKLCGACISGCVAFGPQECSPGCCPLQATAVALFPL